MEYHSAIKKILSFATTWIELEVIMLSEISGAQKDKHCQILHVLIYEVLFLCACSCLLSLALSLSLSLDGVSLIAQAGVQWCHLGSLQTPPSKVQVVLLPQPPE